MKITLLGDVMLNEGQLSSYCFEQKYDFTKAFEKLNKFLSTSEFVVANLETPIAGSEMGFTDEKYLYNSPIEFTKSLKKVGVDMVTTANNHCLDKGEEGLKKTLNNLDRCGLLHIGTHSKLEDSFFIKEIDGIKVGFLAFTYGTNAFSNHNYLNKDQYFMVDMLQDQELANRYIRYIYTGKDIVARAIRKLSRDIGIGQFHIPIYERRESSSRTLKYYKETIKKCKEAGAEYIISCLHIGGQYNDEPLDYTKEICEFSLKNGVDAVIANHEHVIHGIDTDIIDDKFCIYSLGNLLSSNGVTIPPFDKKSEYSVGVHIDLKRCKDNYKRILAEYSFTLFHSFLDDDGKVVCGLLFDTISNCKDNKKRKDLIDINNELVNKVMGTKGKNYPLKQSYLYRK